MATTSIDDAVLPITAAEFKRSFFDALAVTGVTTTTWKPGAVTRTIIAIVCVCLGAFSSLVSSIAKSGFLGLASGLWLRLCARYTFAVTPLDASFAAGPVLLSNASLTPRTYAIGALELAHGVTGARYLNTAAVTVGAGAVDVPVAVQAVEVGSASTALEGELNTIIGGPVGLSCRNAALLVGLDDEADNTLKGRCDAKLQPFADSPSAAYYVAATTAKRADGSRINVNRVRTVPRPNCRIDVYVAGPNGAIPGTADDINTDLGAVEDAIQRQAVPQCVTANTHSATNRVLNVSAEVWVYNTTGTTTAQVDAAIRKALADYFASPETAPIGGHNEGSHGYIWAEDLRAVIMRATYNGAPIRAFKCNLLSPGDTSIGQGEVPTLGTVTLTITRRAPPAGSV